jgi:hypothetical protein
MMMSKNVVIDGIEYAPVKKGNRAVVIIDRGWIYAGDVEDKDGRIYLSRCVWVFKWTGGIGFAKVIEEPRNENVDIRPHADIDVPSGAELFRVPVPNDWGL